MEQVTEAILDLASERCLPEEAAALLAHFQEMLQGARGWEEFESTVRSWLRSDDRWRVEVALEIGLNHRASFDTMAAVYRGIGQRWPELAKVAESRLESKRLDDQYEHFYGFAQRVTEHRKGLWPFRHEYEKHRKRRRFLRRLGESLRSDICRTATLGEVHARVSEHNGVYFEYNSADHVNGEIALERYSQPRSKRDAVFAMDGGMRGVFFSAKGELYLCGFRMDAPGS